uniref:Uncharacterized protein n=1 Tax=Corvus moneduloides TaxID=1196302 RepID=A0A8C3DBS6_CORMO
MAWPCISRVCCLARFWSQLDKSDLSVPLTIHNYSDIEEQEDGPPQRSGPPPRGSARPPAPARRPRDPTQYRRDFRAWPLPRRDDFPWVSASSGGGGGGGGRDGAAPQPAPGRAACALPGGGGRPAVDGPEQLRPRSQPGLLLPRAGDAPPQRGAGMPIPEVKTRFSPNPSAVFQAPSRILNV